MDRILIAEIVQNFITIYTFCIIAWALIGWVNIQQGWFYAIRSFLDSVVQPYINLFRRFIPPINLGGMLLDLSPIVAILLLGFIGRLIVSLIAYGHI